MLTLIVRASDRAFIAHVMRGTELIGIRYVPPYFEIKRNYFGVPNVDIHLGWMLVTPGLYVGLYAPLRKSDPLKTPVVSACAVFFLYVALTWWATEPGASWISERTAPIFAFLIPATIRHARAAQLRYEARRRAACLATHVCPDCGYDFRATPDYCPECGLVVTSARSS
jgi:hypothetical protein